MYISRLELPSFSNILTLYNIQKYKAVFYLDKTYRSNNSEIIQKEKQLKVTPSLKKKKIISTERFVKIKDNPLTQKPPKILKVIAEMFFLFLLSCYVNHLVTSQIDLVKPRLAGFSESLV